MASNTCPTCGNEIPAGEPLALCAKCLLASAVAATEAGGGVDQTLAVAASQVISPPGKIPFHNIGDYELIEELARGGMGIVFRARQISLKRTVALKMIHGGAWASPQTVQRFHTEAEAAAKLDHPHIVPIYEIGNHESHPYFTMKLLVGGSLADRLRDQERGNLPFRSPARTRDHQHGIARFIESVSQAVHYAHLRGVLHRDLKPGNILLDDQGEPHVTDFGVAKLLEQNSGLTLTEAILGSPGYMAPEQAIGKSRDVTTAADIYSVGVVLFELLTGQLPFRGQTPGDIIHAVAYQDPPRPQLLNAAIAADLETICLKCLEKEPSRRYATAQALADDLERYRHDQPIQARPVPGIERIWRWCRRNPLVAGLTGGLALALSSGFVGVLIEWRQAQNRSIENRRLRYVSEINLAHRALQDGDVLRTESLLEAQVPAHGDEDLRSFEWFALKALCRGDATFSLSTGEYVPKAVAFSSTGKWLAIHETRPNDPGVTPEVAQVPSQDVLVILNASTKQVIQSLRQKEAITCLTGSAAHPIVATGHEDGRIRIWNLEEPRLITEFNAHTQAVTALALSQDGKLLASSADAVLKFWSTINWHEEQNAQAGDTGDHIFALAFAPDGKCIAIAHGPAISLLDLATTNRTTIDVGSYVYSLAFTADGKTLAGANDNSFVQLVGIPPNGHDPLTILDLGQHQSTATAVAFRSDNSRLLSASSDHTIKLWDIQEHRPLAVLKGHRGVVSSLAISPDGRTAASASDDHTVKFWRTEPLPDADVLHLTNWVRTTAFSPDGRWLMAGDWGGLMCIWDLTGKQAAHTFLAHTFGVCQALFSKDGKRLITAGDDQLVKIWNAQSLGETPIATLTETNGPVLGLALTPDEKILISATGEEEKPCPGIITFWDLASQREVARFLGNPTGIRSLVLSVDGRVLATGSWDSTVELWDVASRKSIAKFNEHNGGVEALAFSPNGELLAVGSQNSLTLWNVSKRERAPSFGPVMGVVEGLVFTSDGKTLIETSANGLVRLWNVATRRELLTLTGHHGECGQPVISPDGRFVASPSSDGTVRVWPTRRFIQEKP
jgi:WD40 repeat protein/serine/threonine protein kinase